MGDLANALRNCGRLDEALDKTETSLAIQKALGNVQKTATAEALCASILARAGHYERADARFVLALDGASQLYRQALQFSLEAGAGADTMRTYSLIGVAELKAGRNADAGGWFEKSRELAVQLRQQSNSRIHTIPSGLPDELRDILEHVIKAIGEQSA